MPSCNTRNSFQSDEEYKRTYSYVAPGACRNSIRQDCDETPCSENQANTIHGYKQRCMVAYETGFAWVGPCGEGPSNSKCDESQAFCNINKGQRVKDIMPLSDISILKKNDNSINLDYKNQYVSAEIWNRIYEILLYIFNFPIPTDNNDKERRGVRDPFIYELVKCQKGTKEGMYGGHYPDGCSSQNCGADDYNCGQQAGTWKTWLDGTGWIEGLWRWKEKVPSYQSQLNYANSINGSIVYLVNPNSAEVPRFLPYTYNSSNWESLVKNQRIYIRHNLITEQDSNGNIRITGVHPNDSVLFSLFNQILEIMDNQTGKINKGTVITEALLQRIQSNILNFEIDASRCRYCNTYCNADPCQSGTWQGYEKLCEQGGGCTAMYGCMCYFQGIQTSCWQPACGMVCPGMV